MCFAASSAGKRSVERKMTPIIRKMRESDREDLYALLSDPRVMRYLEPPFSREKSESFLRAAGLSEPPLIYAAEDGDGFAGYVICHDYDENSVEIGWVLRPERWGQGLASALTEQLIRSIPPGKELVIECDPEQEATRRIALKFGFAYEGRADGLDLYRLKRRPEP